MSQNRFMSLPRLLSVTAGRLPDKVAIEFRDRSWTYGQVENAARGFSAELVERGVRPGDRVVLLAPNKPEWLVALFGIVGAGAVLVPVNPALTSSEIAFIVEDCAPKLMIVDETQYEKIPDKLRAAVLPLPEIDRPRNNQAQWAAREPGDAAIIFYTSGTTGRPKGAVLSQAANASTAIRVGEAWGMTENDRHLLAGSLSFIYNSIINAGSAFVVGGTVILQERFHPEEALEAVRNRRITVLMSVPTMYVMMAEWASAHTVDASSVRVAISAGASLAPSVTQRVRDRLGIELLDGWGMTEGTPITGYDVRVFARGRPESAGKPLPSCDVRIVDEQDRDLGPDEVGELIFKSPSNMTEYYNRPKETAEALRNGWMYSGDLARRDDEGFVYIVGRKKDMIIRGGANIYPAEIEEMIFNLPSVAECAVVGIPDDRFGETVKAFVVPAAGQQVSADDIIRQCKGGLAEYKVPAEIEFLESLPKGPTGKILKRLLLTGKETLR